ncbi:carboxypeptidase PM20D1 [Shimia isoporae]|uniref:Carboxypeptidase PM20D1 n=1 Tax=Shimia isoporae TaxID=647720 RepID=A0A4R1NR92_9RHOB|nr:M20/M25/M40 family metallo-hydrolase [Shimia isoporae]TCL09253.1 carboxypeptidase PM20D1 [Shimia isoporae]
MILRVLKYIGLALLVLVVILAVKTALYKAPDYAPADAAALPDVTVDVERIVANMAEAVTYETVAQHLVDPLVKGQFTGFLEWIEQTYPGVHASMDREMANLTPIYKWTGKNPEAQPVLMTGHYDVVPAPDAERDRWQHPPFAGIADADFVWGRGTIDDKIGVIGLLEAAETLISKGFQPERTIYFIFGHDEEIGGQNGAGAAVELLRARGVQMEWSLDEGSMVLDDVLPGLPAPVASINVAEKGYVTLNITAKSTGGHSSLPPADTAVGALAVAVERLMANPVPGGLTDATADFFDSVAPEFGLVERVLFANQWLFRPVLEGILSGSGPTNAMLRTTTAPTMLQASLTENVLPTEAVAVVNFRIHPRDTVESVVAHVEAVINNPEVEVTVRGEPTLPSPVSSSESEGFQLLAQATLGAFGDVILVPGLTVAGTDTKHFSKISDDSYRFNPMTFGPDDLSRIHGINERVSIADLERAVQFYAQIMMGLDG